MDLQQAIDILSTRIPMVATDIYISGERVYFTMPKDWHPSQISGIFDSAEYGPVRRAGYKTWQYRR